MDRNEFAKQRKEEVVRLLQNMNIKKGVADGFAREDVYTCMQDLCNFYEASIAQLEQLFDSEKAAIHQQMGTDKQAMEQQIAQVRQEAREKAEEEASVKNKELLQRLQKYEANNDVYMNMMMEAKKNSNEIVSRARAEVSQMMEEGQQQLAES